ncbi:uncharacterized protein NKAPD1 [Amia ocellicauda]|uniref:uncharacterized protein NKAPD1 n=1 Tax=Amia ocellicauda TaxID=2972642 RepID=UPI003463EB6A
MSRVPMGKMLLRNVIRHTDAHNKIQEESEMWKKRELEVQVPTEQTKWHRRMLAPDPGRARMHSDGWADAELPQTQREVTTRSSEEDLREARHWTKKLYTFEANDPDRWGHSGFKELYPEEFESGSDKQHSDDENIQQQKKAPKSTSREPSKHKHSKKSVKKKKQKKKVRKRKKEEEESDSDGSDRRKRRKKSSKGKRKKRRKEKGGKKESHSDSSGGGSSGESEAEDRGERPARDRRKRHRAARPQSPAPGERCSKKRKNWKVANEEKSEESSED